MIGEVLMLHWHCYGNQPPNLQVLSYAHLSIACSFQVEQPLSANLQHYSCQYESANLFHDIIVEIYLTEHHQDFVLYETHV